MHFYKRPHHISEYDMQFRIITTAQYISAFKIRQPIAYVLWYYWRLRMPLTPAERKQLPPQIAHFDNSGDRSMWPNTTYLTEFAIRHPYLFLFVDLFQFLKKTLTAPRQVVSAGEPDAASAESVN